MKMKQVRNNKKRAAFTMLELVMVTAMLTTVMTSVIVLIRTSYSVWEAHEQDLERTENVYAALRHLSRQIRQADSVAAITAPAANDGSLTLVMSNGETHIWARQASGVVTFRSSATGYRSDDLAEYITALTFTGYEADGLTATTNLNDIQSVECRATTTLPRGAGEARITTCRSWLRTW